MVELKVPKKYLERFGSLEREFGLIDDCKYMLYFSNGWEFNGYISIPVRSKNEALKYLKECYKIYEEK